MRVYQTRHHLAWPQDFSALNLQEELAAGLALKRADGVIRLERPSSGVGHSQHFIPRNQAGRIRRTSGHHVDHHAVFHRGQDPGVRRRLVAQAFLDLRQMREDVQQLEVAGVLIAVEISVRSLEAGQESVDDGHRLLFVGDARQGLAGLGADGGRVEAAQRGVVEVRLYQAPGLLEELLSRSLRRGGQTETEPKEKGELAHSGRFEPAGAARLFRGNKKEAWKAPL